MTRRSLVVALACSLAVAGCLGGVQSVSDADRTLTETTTAPAETTADAPRRAEYDSYEELAAGAPFPVPDPNVTDAFEFQSGLLMTLGGDAHVAMAYHRTESGTLENVVSVRKAESDSLYDPSAGNATTVGDRDARYVESDDGSRKLVWRCDGYSYRVSVQKYTDEFGEAELRAVAESVGCE